MPKRRTDDVVNVVMTDHYIQRRKPGRDLLAPLKEAVQTAETSYRGEVNLYYPADLPSGRDRDLYLAVAQVADESNLDRGTERLQEAIEKYRPSEASFYFALAEAYWKKGKRAEAFPFYEAALERDPEHVQARINFSTALSQAAQLDRAAQILQEGLRLEPGSAKMLSNLGDIYNQGRNFSKASEVLTEAIRHDPDLPDAFHNLANTRAGLGDQKGAEEALRNSLRIQPDFEPALNNLGNLLSEKGEAAEAENYYKKAIELSHRGRVAVFENIA
jgi:tetratricopeptide (TPR) repeat protein